MVVSTHFESQKLIDKILIDFFDVSIKQAQSIDQYYGTLWEKLRLLHTSGGKRLRPKLVMMAYQAFGGKNENLVAPIAAAQELLHFSMLIHDDIIDRDTTRYGVDNMTGIYEKIYQPFVADTIDRTHYANGSALIAGDLMIAGAYKLIFDSKVSDSHKITSLKIMYDGTFDVAGGQLLDTESSLRPAGSINPIEIAEYKTASYSFLGPLLTGAVLAGADDLKLATIRTFAVNLGIAYQLTDDLLGVFGDEAKTGKSNSGDIREGKQTYLVQATVERLTATQTSLFKQFFGKHDLSADEVDTTKQLIVESGALDDVKKLTDSYITHATDALTELAFDDVTHHQFLDLINTTTKRDF